MLKFKHTGSESIEYRPLSLNFHALLGLLLPALWCGILCAQLVECWLGATSSCICFKSSHQVHRAAVEYVDLTPVDLRDLGCRRTKNPWLLAHTPGYLLHKGLACQEPCDWSFPNRWRGAWQLHTGSGCSECNILATNISLWPTWWEEPDQAQPKTLV